MTSSSVSAGQSTAAASHALVAPLSPLPRMGRRSSTIHATQPLQPAQHYANANAHTNANTGDTYHKTVTLREVFALPVAVHRPSSHLAPAGTASSGTVAGWDCTVSYRFSTDSAEGVVFGLFFRPADSDGADASVGGRNMLESTAAVRPTDIVLRACEPVESNGGSASGSVKLRLKPRSSGYAQALSASASASGGSGEGGGLGDGTVIFIWDNTRTQGQQQKLTYSITVSLSPVLQSKATGTGSDDATAPPPPPPPTTFTTTIKRS